MKIAIYTRNAPNSYSGGRFYTMFLATALAQHHEVFYVSNVEPLFARDFREYPNFTNIHFCIDENFHMTCNGCLDVIFLIPGLDTDLEVYRQFYLTVIHKGYKDDARLLFLDFETPLWFNQVSSYKKDPKRWIFWEKSTLYCDAILSSTQTGLGYAKEFYPPDKYFTYCYPAINQIVADKIKDSYVKKDQIIVFARFFDTHKGSYELLEIFGENIRGYTLKIVIGSGEAPEEFCSKLAHKAKEWDVELEYLHRITDEEKFRHIAESKFLLFLSNFEGFGSPPVEALYLKTHVIAKYLDVLYEVSQDNITYISSTEEFLSLDLNEILARPISHNPQIEMKNFVNNLDKIVLEVKQRVLKRSFKNILLNIERLYFGMYGLIDVVKRYCVSVQIKQRTLALEQSQRVYIYGTGNFATHWTKWCERNGKEIIGYLVSEKKEEEFLGKKVYVVSEIKEMNDHFVILSSISEYSGFSMRENMKQTPCKFFLFTPYEAHLVSEDSIKEVAKDSIEFCFNSKVFPLRELFYKIGTWRCKYR